MPFARPTILNLVARTSADIATRLGVGALLKRGFLPAFAHALSAGIHGAYGYMAYATRQILPDTSDAEWLERHGNIFDVPRKAATKAAGLVTFTGTAGSAIQVGTLVQRADGEQYSTRIAATILVASVDVQVDAVVAGFAGNSDPLTPLTLSAPVAGVDAEAVVQTPGIFGGADAETDEAYRKRVLLRYRLAKGGGTKTDWEQWTLEVAGVTRVFVLPSYPSIGEIGVTFAVDDDPTGPIPSPAKVAEVAAHLESNHRPLGSKGLGVFQPLAQPLDPTIKLIPDSAEIRTTVELSLQTLVDELGGPGATIPLSKLTEAISVSPGESDHQLLAPTEAVVVGPGSLLVLGTITWSA